MAPTTETLSSSSLSVPSGRKKIFGFFSRSRSPSPSPTTARNKDQGRLKASNSVAPSSTSDVGPQNKYVLRSAAERQPRNAVVEISERPRLALEPLEVEDPRVPRRSSAVTRVLEREAIDIPGSAFNEAWGLLDDTQREALQVSQGVQELFMKLSLADEQHRANSPFRRGMSKLNPYLENFKAVVGLASPFASLHPIANTATGLVSSITSIAVILCGAADDLTDQIASFLERVPALERCNKLVATDPGMANVHDVLVKIFQDLLRFYLAVNAMYKRAGFILHAATNLLKPQLPELISSFNKHVDVLNDLLQVEIFAATKDIRDKQIDECIRDNLDTDGGHEEAFHNELRRRTDDACNWITTHESFQTWLTSDSMLLAMLGNMGSGKTMTTAYVEDSLSKKQIVCAYYCKDDAQTSRLGKIYRSLIWQLLKRQPTLKFRFWKWYKKTEPISQVNPTRSEEYLQEFLFEALTTSKDIVFIVLDGLDECLDNSRCQLMSLFRKLKERGAPVKVFLSSRYDEDVENDLPDDTVKLMMASSKEKDRLIASYLAQDKGIPSRIQELVIRELSHKADGSAIWLRIAMEYVKRVHTKSERGFQDALKNLPSSQGLAELYSELFVKLCEGEPDNERLLQQALEILAIAQRPLTSDELACAVFMDPDLEDDSIITIAELTEIAFSRNLLDLIRPFVNVTAADGEIFQIRLVHQSLKELLLRAPPTSWDSFDQTKVGKQNLQRQGQLNAMFLKRCVAYLLLEEVGEKDLMSSFEIEPIEADFFAIGGVLDENEEQQLSSPVNCRDFDPLALGLGSFFAHAAAYWTTYLEFTPEELHPSPSELITLCSAGSLRLKNWVEQWRRPNCSYVAEHDYPADLAVLDPLVVIAMFGSAKTMASMLKCNLQAPDFHPDSVWTALSHLVQRGSVSTIKSLVSDKRLGSELCCFQFFYEVIIGWSKSDKVLSTESHEWVDIFDFLIQELRQDLLRCGNDILCHAAGNGCFVLVKSLFKAADRDICLRESLLGTNRGRKGREYNNNNNHQSIGEAAWEGHADIVRFLCQQQGIDAHLHYVNSWGRTVFHQAARSGSTEVFQILLERWPEGANLPNTANDTALIELIFSSTRGDERTLRTVQEILATGKVDATGRDRHLAYNAPLCTAIRRGNRALCRVLILEGAADISCAVGVENGRPVLLTPANDPKTVLKDLCSLLPITVSTEYLQ